MNWQAELIQASAFFYKIGLITRKRVFHVFEILFWPAIGLVSVGLLTRYLQLGPDKVAFVLIGVIALSVLQVGQLDISYVILYSVWNKSLKHEIASPMTAFHLVFGAWIMGIIHSVLVFFLLSGFSAWAFDFRFLDAGPSALALFFLGLVLSSAVIGVVVIALAFRFGGRAHVGATSIVSIIILLSGIYYPVSVLPQPLQALSACIPVTYFLEFFRSHYGFEPVSGHLLLKGYLLVFFYLAASVGVLQHSIRHAKMSGVLLKMSE